MCFTGAATILVLLVLCDATVSRDASFSVAIMRFVDVTRHKFMNQPSGEMSISVTEAEVEETALYVQLSCWQSVNELSCGQITRVEASVFPALKAGRVSGRMLDLDKAEIV